MGERNVKARLGVVLAAAVLLLAACETRSISNSGYAGRGNPAYRGELTEFEVLGIDVARPASDREIAQQLDRRHKLALRQGETMMLIQTGAPIPDGAMVKALSQHFSVVPFSGVPLATTRDHPDDYARALRLAAAKAGAEAILCYWGVLESARESEPTKVVSWIPIVGMAVPDEGQRMRIRLKLAVIDVRTGTWAMLAPQVFDDSALSASVTRVASDQRQVEELKDEAYDAAVKDIVAHFAG